MPRVKRAWLVRAWEGRKQGWAVSLTSTGQQHSKHSRHKASVGKQGQLQASARHMCGKLQWQFHGGYGEAITSQVVEITSQVVEITSK